jgi:hypothetical protein
VYTEIVRQKQRQRKGIANMEKKVHVQEVQTVQEEKVDVSNLEMLAPEYAAEIEAKPRRYRYDDVEEQVQDYNRSSKLFYLSELSSRKLSLQKQDIQIEYDDEEYQKLFDSLK